MSQNISLPGKAFISETGYFAITGIFFGLAIISTATRTFIQIHHLKKVNIEDYLIFIGVAAHIAATGLRSAWISLGYEVIAIAEGRILPPPDLMQKAVAAAQYALASNFLYWITIYSVKWSFLFYFKALIYRLKRMETWWWLTVMVFVPVTVIAILSPFIACPHAGRSIIVHCVPTPAFVRREHNFVYVPAALDIITDIMLISIPVIVLRKSSFNFQRKMNIGAVLCLSLFMIAIGLIRIISTSIQGTQDQIWNVFWIQVEASVSLIIVCPTVFRSLFLIKTSPSYKPNKGHHANQAHVSGLRRVWARKKPGLTSIDVGATLTGMQTLFRDSEHEQLGSYDGDATTAVSSTQMQDTHSSHSHGATKPSMEIAHEVSAAAA